MTCPDCDGGGQRSACDLCEGQGTIGEVEFAFLAREDPGLLLRLLRSPITPDADLVHLCEAAGGIRTHDMSLAGDVLQAPACSTVRTLYLGHDMSLAGDVLQALVYMVRFWPTADVREGAVRGLARLGTDEARRMLAWVAEFDEDEAVREVAREATE